MTKAELFAALDARKPDIDKLIARLGVLDARRYLFGYVQRAAAAMGLDISTAEREVAEWWDNHYSQVN